MKRSALVAQATIAVATLPLLSVFAAGTGTPGPFETRLPPDRQIIHVLNRLTFGPRPGDVEEVRRIGLEKWIDLQLHPERIPGNKTLEARLEPLETLRMDPAQVTKEYIQAPQQMIMMAQPANVMNNMPQEQRRQLMNGTAEERKAVLAALDDEKRKQVLLFLPPTNLASLPEYQKEAEDLRKAQQDERQQEMRRRNPPLADLLTPEQVTIARTGTLGQVRELLDGLDSDKLRLVAGAMPPQALAEFPEIRRQGMRQRQPLQVVSGDVKGERIFDAIYSDRQLEEVLVDFWLNHFSIYENKNIQGPANGYRALFASYERDAIRPHVLRHFRDLLLATARHPAMLYYLDNWMSMSTDARDRVQVGPFALGFNLPPGIAGGPRQDHGLNENYGRELMELHTMGVGGGYTQQDVIEVARCFTGWTVRKPDSPEFDFVEFMHDQGEKIVLGHKIAANGGENDGLQVIDILARHPSTARFISRQLAQRFVADNPPESLVTRMALTFQKTDGDLRAVLQTMFSSTEFLSEGAWEAKIKSPFEMVVSAVRATSADAIDSTVLVQKIADLGEPLYGRVEPNGYPLIGDGWLGTADLMGRMSFGMALMGGKVPGVHPDTSRWEGRDAAVIAHDILGRDAAPETLDALKALPGTETDPHILAGFIIGSPEFNRR